MTGYQEVHDRRAEGWVIEVDSASGELTVAAPEGVEGSVEIPLSVTYPDGSQDTTWAKAWAFKPHADAYDIAFDTVTIDAGATFYAQPNNIEHPVDTTVTLVPSQELESLQEDGWTIEGDTGIGFFITAPRTATTGAQLPLTVTYPDGTTEPTSITITVVPIALVELHEVTYGGVDVTGGESVTASPTETDLPAGTRITLGDNIALNAAGWTFKVTADGGLTATAPNDADGTVEIVLTVTYPDGTTEPATAKVTATPAPEDKEDDEAPKGKEDDEGDQPVVPNRLEAGGSSFGSS